MFLKGKGREQGNRGSVALGPDLGFLSREAYNAIRTNLSLSFHGKEKEGRVIGITSPSPQDGKSYTAVNVAYALAKDGNRVLLINGDLRLPSLERYMGLTYEKGLSNYLCGECSPEEGLPVIEHVMDVELSVLAAGDIPPTPSELLGSAAMEDLLQQVRHDYDYVVLDLPPISSVIDAIAVSPYLDGMVLVVRQDHTRKRDIRETISKLKFTHVRLLGFVVNDFSASVGKKYRYKYYS